MKKLFIIKCVLLSSFIFIISCSDLNSNNKTDKDEVSFTRLSGGQIIGEKRGESYYITVNVDSLKLDFEELLKEQNIDAKIIGVEIQETFDENYPEQKFYILYAYNEDYSVKSAFFLNLENNVFRYPENNDDSPNGAGITCTSTQCQFGCAPVALVNPATGKKVLTCSTCTNVCTKVATFTPD